MPIESPQLDDLRYDRKATLEWLITPKIATRLS